MRMLLTAYPSRAHLHLLIPIALAAREAGHEVAFATSTSRCREIERLGMSAHAAGLEEDDPEFASLIAEGRKLNGFQRVALGYRSSI